MSCSGMSLSSDGVPHTFLCHLSQHHGPSAEAFLFWGLCCVAGVDQTAYAMNGSYCNPVLA